MEDINNLKIIANLVFNFRISGKIEDDRDDLVQEVEATEVIVNSEGNFLRIEGWSMADSHDYQTENEYVYFEDIEVSVGMEIRNSNLQAAKKEIIEQLSKANFSFEKDERIEVSFIRINQWEFFDLDEDPDGEEYVFALGGEFQDEGGEEFEFEIEMFGEDGFRDGEWQMGPTGNIFWDK